MKDLINWHELSRRLSGNGQNIRPNFINSNYKPFAGDWIKKKDDTMVFHPLVIVEDYAESKMS